MQYCSTTHADHKGTVCVGVRYKVHRSLAGKKGTHCDPIRIVLIELSYIKSTDIYKTKDSNLRLEPNKMKPKPRITIGHFKVHLVKSNFKEEDRKLEI